MDKQCTFEKNSKNEMLDIVEFLKISRSLASQLELLSKLELPTEYRVIVNTTAEKLVHVAQDYLGKKAT